MSSSHARLFPRRGGRSRHSRSGPRLLSAPADLAGRLEHAEPLDRVTQPLAEAIRRGLPTGGRADALHGVWLGQPVHPALVALPLGLAGTLPAAAAGLADYASLHREQQRVGLVHAASGAGASALFAASLLARMAGRDNGGRLLALGGLAAVTTGGFLGRHLAFGLGAGASHAEPVAHLTALGWHDLCRIYELPDGRLARRRLGYLTLTMLRQGNDVLALADQCAHLGGPLHQGTLTDDGGGPCVTCPWHGSTFRLTDGAVVHGPATARQPAFDTRVVEGGMVQVRPAGPARAR